MNVNMVLGGTVGAIILCFGAYRIWSKGIEDGIQTMSLGIIPISIAYTGLVRAEELGVWGATSAYALLLSGTLGTVWHIRDNLSEDISPP